VMEKCDANRDEETLTLSPPLVGCFLFVYILIKVKKILLCCKYNLFKYYRYLYLLVIINTY
jgi:hypothetical protein